jgi:prophage regulatory protein
MEVIEMAKLLGIDQVCDEVGHRPSWIYDQVSKGNFPKPVKLSTRSARWFSDEIDAWIESLRAKRNPESGI